MAAAPRRRHRRTVRLPATAGTGSQVTPEEAKGSSPVAPRPPEPEFTISIRSHWDGKDVGMM